MTDEGDWPARLKLAAQVLEATSAAPGWLAAVVRDSIAVATALAPMSPKEAVPTDFFYPH